jgi:ATP-dependent NAD(P)H-hydrate dehydratase
MSFNLQLISRFKELMPKLVKDSHKGQSGRVGIVGGSKEYSGAPYFASISALRAGADLAYVFTTREAAAVIKAYSPELIVLPVLDAENNELEMHTWIGKVHSLVIGPGLGRSEPAFKVFNL